MINDQDMESRELEASIMYLTDQYCQTKLKSTYLQIEVNNYQKLIQMKFPFQLLKIILIRIPKKILQLKEQKFVLQKELVVFSVLQRNILHMFLKIFFVE